MDAATKRKISNLQKALWKIQGAQELLIGNIGDDSTELWVHAEILAKKIELLLDNTLERS